jgi:hypothetical protein
MNMIRSRSLASAGIVRERMELLTGNSDLLIQKSPGGPVPLPRQPIWGRVSRLERVAQD